MPYELLLIALIIDGSVAHLPLVQVADPPLPVPIELVDET